VRLLGSSNRESAHLYCPAAGVQASERTPLSAKPHDPFNAQIALRRSLGLAMDCLFYFGPGCGGWLPPKVLQAGAETCCKFGDQETAATSVAPGFASPSISLIPRLPLMVATYVVHAKARVNTSRPAGSRVGVC